MFKSPSIEPPPPPAAPANPPTYASAAMASPRSQQFGRFGPLGDTVLTGPMGAPESGASKRKSLLGQ